MAENLVSNEECRALVPTPLSDEQLVTVIEWVEAEVTGILGAPYDGTSTITETLPGGNINIFTKRPISSISSLTEYSSMGDTTGAVLTEGSDFYVWGDQGRIERIGASGFFRTPPSANDVFYMSDAQFMGGRGSAGFGQRVTVVYIPQDQRAKRRQAIIDLVRILLSRTALKYESVGGEYMYTAPDNWEEEKQRVLRNLMFKVVG